MDINKKWSRTLTAEEYANGLRAIDSKICEEQRDLLVAHYRSPLRRATTKSLAQAVGVKGHSSVILYYVRLAQAFCDATGERPDFRTSGPKKGKERWWVVWSNGWREKQGFTWELLPQVAEAIRKIGWVDSEVTKFPDDLQTTEGMVEGAAQTTVVNAYERNSQARRACIEYYGASCSICEFDFGEFYGSHAKGYIHVHHIVPLSDIRGEYTVDPIKDLRPVCPNCHAMLHLSGSCRTIEELRSLVDLASQCADRIKLPS